MRRSLSSVETLPAEGLFALQWAFDVLRARRMTQVAILEQLNSRLAALGVPLVSRSSFNRYAIKVWTGSVARPVPIAPAPGAGSDTLSDADREGIAASIAGQLRGVSAGEARAILSLAASRLGAT